MPANCCFFSLAECQYLFKRGSLVHLIRHLGYDDQLFAVLGLLDMRFGAQRYFAAARFVRFTKLALADYVTARRKVRRRDKFHKAVKADIGLVYLRDYRVYRFADIMRWNVRSKADGYAAGAVYQKVGGSGPASTDGSFSESSKLRVKSTVSLSISRNSSSAGGVIRTSV